MRCVTSSGTGVVADAGLPSHRPGMMLAPCENGCAVGRRYQATLSQDPARLAEVAALWHRLGWRQKVVSAEEIACDGCTPSRLCHHGIAACAGRRGVTLCGACPEYPECLRMAAALGRTESFAETCRSLCSPEDYSQLERAFFEKRRRLEEDRGRRSR